VRSALHPPAGSLVFYGISVTLVMEYQLMLMSCGKFYNYLYFTIQFQFSQAFIFQLLFHFSFYLEYLQVLFLWSFFILHDTS